MMKPLAAVTEYYYWSERLVTKLWEDNASGQPDKLSVSASLLNLGVQKQQSDPLNTRAARAASTEELLTDQIVRDLDYEGPVSYLAGRSLVVLSILESSDGDYPGAVTIFSDMRSPEGKKVAVCLFGSARNVCDWNPEPPEWRKFGWTSSTSEGVRTLLQAAANAENSRNPEAYWRETAERQGANLYEICWNAQNICANQGMAPGSPYHEAPWRRGYTIGQYEDVEWLARIYFSYDESHTEPRRKLDTPFDVIHVGAALWVRSSSPDVWTPYTAENIAKLNAAKPPIRHAQTTTRRRRLPGRHRP
jgi:hypothetical protein